MLTRLAAKGAKAAALLPVVWLLSASAECLSSSKQSGAAGVTSGSQRPADPRGVSRTLESEDSALRDALASVRASRTCATLTQLGLRYIELDLSEPAMGHLLDAVKLDSRCAAAHDALARVWRGSGLHGQALGSASRAIYFSPRTAGFWNTYGTVLQEIGRNKEAAAAYRRVVELDASAAYAHSNLCYLAMQDGDDDAAATACLAALVVDAAFVPALNNLALLRAASGESADAFQLFASAGGTAVAHYNMGMVRLSQRDFPAALEAFEAAYRDNAAFDAAYEKARLVRRILKQRTEKTSADGRR